MRLADLAGESLPFLKLSDKGEFALEQMILHKVFDLPVAESSVFLGNLTAEVILDHAARRKSISSLTDYFQHEALPATAPLHQGVALMTAHHLSVLPLIDDEGQLSGTISMHDLMGHYASLSGVSHPGGSLVLEMPSYSYSLAEIARLAESNNAHILSSYIQPIPDSGRLLVFVKFNVADLNGIMATYERFGYEVAAYFHESDFDFYSERYQALMHYLSL